MSEDHDLEHAIDTGGPMPPTHPEQKLVWLRKNILDYLSEMPLPPTHLRDPQEIYDFLHKAAKQNIMEWLAEMPLRDAQEVYEFLHRLGCRIY